jgi:hypothetical protein
MNRKLVFWPEAEAELAEAVDWYETRGNGLGADFIEPLMPRWRRSSATRINIRSSRAGVIRKGGSNERNRACCYDRYYDLPVSYFLKPT